MPRTIAIFLLSIDGVTLAFESIAAKEKPKHGKTNEILTATNWFDEEYNPIQRRWINGVIIYCGHDIINDITHDSCLYSGNVQNFVAVGFG